MAVDYAEMMQSGPADDSAAARAPVVSFERVKPKRLTKKSKSALLKRRNAEKSTMAKGKKRSAAQIAAQKKAVAASLRARKAGKSGKGGTRRKTIRSRGRRASAAAVVMAREPSTAIVKYKEPRQVIVTKKKKAAKKRSGKSGSASKRGASRGGWTKAKRRAAGKKAAATRKRHARAGRSAPKRSSGKKRGGRRSTRIRGRRRARAVITVSASERRGRRRRGSRRRRGAMENPLTGVELFIGTLTGLMGFGTADVVDRIIATHALTGVTSGTVTAYTDVPPTASPAQGTAATYGSLFNSTAVCAPMNITRWLAGLGISGAPILIGHFVSAPVGRSALQFFGFGALMRVAGKGLIDMVAALSKSNMTGMRLYSGEQRAAAVLHNDGTAAQLPAQAMTGLGRARIAGSLAAPTLQMHKQGCGCGNCKGQLTAGAGAGYPSMPAPQSVPQVPANPPVASTNPPVPNTTPPVDQNIAIRGIPSGFQPHPGMYNWGHKAA
jgi:hypothetical protein